MKLIEKAIPLHNQTCPYCGVDLALSQSETEHVIAREFVPKGSIQSNDWNLIVSACRPCNHFKSTSKGRSPPSPCSLRLGRHILTQH